MRMRALSALMFGLALLVQILAPVTSAWALARATDPFEHLVICSQQATQTDDTDRGSLPMVQHDHCVLCQIGSLSGPPSSFVDTFVISAFAIARKMDWTPFSARAPPGAIRRYAPPRGPPTFS